MFKQKAINQQVHTNYVENQLVIQITDNYKTLLKCSKIYLVVYLLLYIEKSIKMKIKTFILILTIIATINCAIAPVLPFFFNKTTVAGSNPSNPSSGPISITDFFRSGQSSPPIPQPLPPNTVLSNQFPPPSRIPTNNFPSRPLPDSGQQSLPQKEPAQISQGSNSNFASARQKVERCKTTKCSRSEASPKFKISASLKDYVKSQYAKLTVKPSKDQADAKFAQFEQRAGKKQTDSQRQRKQGSARLRSNRVSYSSFGPQFIKQVFSTRGGSGGPKDYTQFINRARLLESQNNEYSQINEGNKQANNGNKCIYRLNYDPNTFGQKITPVVANGINLSSQGALYFSSFNYIHQIHASKNFLLIISSFSSGNGYYTLVLKFPIDPNSCSIDTFNPAYYVKKGYFTRMSKQTNGRVIIVTNDQLSNWDPNWYIYEFGNSVTVQANQIGFLSGVYQNVVPAVWSIPLSFAQNDYYFEQYFFADWTYFNNLQSSNILYITSIAWQGTPTYNIQAITSINSNIFGSYAYSNNFVGYIYNSRSQDQNGDIFRIVSVDFSNNGASINRLNVPDLSLADPSGQEDVSYNGQYLSSVLFVNDYAYLTFNSIIRVVLCMGGPATYTDYPNNPGQTVHTLLKFQNGWVVGFGTKLPSSAPVVSLYKVTINAPFTFFKSFQLTQGYSYINVNQWDTQSFLINPTTNTIVFNLVNTNSPPVPSTMYLGMYYLHVHTNGCIGYLPLPGGCPPGPNTTIFGPVYKHYPSQTYQAGQSQYVDAYTIVQQNGQSYLYSSSNGQMQARKISQTNNLPQIYAPSSSGLFLN